MKQGSGETLEEYLARLREAREVLVTKIERPEPGFALGAELAASRTRESDPLEVVRRELRAIEATKLFRLRAKAVELHHRLSGAKGASAAETVKPRAEYERWVSEVDEIQEFETPWIEAAVNSMCAKPVIGIVSAIGPAEISAARDLVAGLAAQFYDGFWLTLVVVGEASEGDLAGLREAIGAKGEVVLATNAKDTTEGLNEALQRQKSDWALAMTAGDELTRHALYTFAQAVVDHPHADMIYSDEDVRDAGGNRSQPNFKPDWNEPLLLSTNYLGSSVLFRRSRLLELGGFRQGLWDAWLRYTEGLPADAIVHLPYVLYHARTSSHAPTNAVLEALARRNIAGQALSGEVAGTVSLKLDPPLKPKVSIIIPTRNQAEILRACIESIDSVTAYPSFEYVIVDNGTDEPESLAYLAKLADRPDVTVIRDPSPFNYSALNNLGAYHASGEVLALLNNDLEAVDPDWMSQLVAYATRPETGIVGARLLFPDRTIQHAGVAIGFSYSCLEHAIQRLDPNLEGYQIRVLLDQWMSAVMGACMFVRKSVYDEIGGLDTEGFPVTCNDVDLCLKARLAGYQNVYAGSVVCIHHESKSRGSNETPARRKASQRASTDLAARWGVGYEDPYFNPNLALWPGSFRVSFSPRVVRPWYR